MSVSDEKLWNIPLRYCEGVLSSGSSVKITTKNISWDNLLVLKKANGQCPARRMPPGRSQGNGMGRTFDRGLN